MMAKMTTKEVVDKSRQYNLFSWSVQSKVSPLVIDTAEGIYLYTKDGEKYVDLSAQLINTNVGHQNKKVIQAIKDQADQLTFVSPGFATEIKARCAEKIIGLLPDTFGKCFFTNAGAESNENAIKIARYYTGKQKIMSRYRSYHGATMGALSLTGDPRRWPAEPGIPGIVRVLDPFCYRCPFGKEYGACEFECVKHVEEVIMYEGADNIAAFIYESSVGTNGMFPAPKEWYQGVRKICDKNGILMIADEVMAGWGRTGKMFAFENFDYVPDIITTAKGITSGYVPLGVVAVSTKIAEFFEDNMLAAGLTYSGHTLAMAAAIACIEVYEEDKMVENSAELGKLVGEKMNELKAKHKCIGDVRGLGLFWGIEFVKNRKTKELMCPFGGGPSPLDELRTRLLKRGIIVLIHWGLLQFGPPLCITKEQVEDAFKILDEEITYIDAYAE